jgi:hypothetical protein
MKLIVMKFSVSFCNFLCLKSKYEIKISEMKFQRHAGGITVLTRQQNVDTNTSGEK